MWMQWGYPPWVNFYVFMLFFLLSSIVASIAVPAYRAWADRRNRPQEIEEVSLRAEPGADRPRIRSGYAAMFLLALGTIFVFVKGSPPIRIFLAVSIVGGTAITLVIRYLAGHRPSISLDQPAGMTDTPPNTKLEQIDRDFLQ